MFFEKSIWQYFTKCKSGNAVTHGRTIFYLPRFECRLSLEALIQDDKCKAEQLNQFQARCKKFAPQTLCKFVVGEEDTWLFSVWQIKSVQLKGVGYVSKTHKGSHV